MRETLSLASLPIVSLVPSDCLSHPFRLSLSSLPMVSLIPSDCLSHPFRLSLSSLPVVSLIPSDCLSHPFRPAGLEHATRCLGDRCRFHRRQGRFCRRIENHPDTWRDAASNRPDGRDQRDGDHPGPEWGAPDQPERGGGQTNSPRRSY